MNGGPLYWKQFAVREKFMEGHQFRLINLYFISLLASVYTTNFRFLFKIQIELTYSHKELFSDRTAASFQGVGWK